MILSLCNEVLREHKFADQCRMAANLGYQGLEIAPFTLTDDPFSLTNVQISEFRNIAEDHGLIITGLHWLLVAPSGLSITTDDQRVAERTFALIERLIEIAALFGATVLVHGSPDQRSLSHAATPEIARANALSFFQKASLWAEKSGCHLLRGNRLRQN